MGVDSFRFRRQLHIRATQGFLASVFKLHHFGFQQEKVALGKQVQVALEGHVPVFGRPLPQIFQAVGDQPGVDILFLVQHYVRLDVDEVGPGRLAFLDPGSGSDFFVSPGYGGGGGEHALAADVVDDAVAGFNPLHFASVFGFQALLRKAQVPSDVEVVIVAVNHPEVMRHI